MKQIDIMVPVTTMHDDELTETDFILVKRAREATYRSYAPYSKFHVGAAILLDNGEIVTGSNQENAATPSSLCAERTAAYYAHSTYPDAKFMTIAIAARDTTGKELKDPISPCGACRQALLEFETLAGHDVRVILAGSDQCHVLESVHSLLPLSFTHFE
ncbi:cytidine deaminase [uncultured Muribaculum sp.]|uniref:cytidine deaminase n=1 Tax=uncultured Muribaculum sp. TaxID=1918613 RepID=UPI0025F8E1CF|nr:cytidine deaminase [uncultured Muribaculum sp.]